jgi:chromosome segregation ATPase
MKDAKTTRNEKGATKMRKATTTKPGAWKNIDIEATQKNIDAARKIAQADNLRNAEARYSRKQDALEDLNEKIEALREQARALDGLAARKQTELCDLAIEINDLRNAS